MNNQAGLLKIVLGSMLFVFLTDAQAVSVMANQFARETGTIGGTTQACGGNITEYNSRVIEAINVLAASPGDRQEAMTVYMDALSKSQDSQTKNHVMNCSQVIQGFNSLPLMKPDYKTVVLPELAKMASPGVSNITPVNTNNSGVQPVSAVEPTQKAANNNAGNTPSNPMNSNNGNK